MLEQLIVQMGKNQKSMCTINVDQNFGHECGWTEVDPADGAENVQLGGGGAKFLQHLTGFVRAIPLASQDYNLCDVQCARSGIACRWKAISQEVHCRHAADASVLGAV